MSSRPRTWTDRVFIGFQRLAPRRLLTRIVYRLTRIRVKPVKNLTIRWFVSQFSVDVSDAENRVPNGYMSFNDFFTRSLKTGAREIDTRPDAVISPCDGTISQVGRLDGERLLQAKGIDYTLNELLAGDAELTREFANGRFVTIYLAPYNYHRVHMPTDGTLTRECHTGHDLFSVNATTARNIPGLFVKNERLVTVYETSTGPMAVIFVGALNVGSITTVWSGERKAGGRTSSDWQAHRVPLAKADLLGWFNMGSTVIVLGTDKAFEWLPRLEAGATVRLGQHIATLTAH